MVVVYAMFVVQLESQAEQLWISSGPRTKFVSDFVSRISVDHSYSIAMSVPYFIVFMSKSYYFEDTAQIFQFLTGMKIICKIFQSQFQIPNFHLNFALGILFCHLAESVSQTQRFRSSRTSLPHSLPSLVFQSFKGKFIEHNQEN